MKTLSEVKLERLSTDGDIRTFAEILVESLSFPSLDESDWLGVEGAENFRVVRRDGEIAGGLVLRKMAQWFGGRSVPMGGIRCVAVAPHHRGVGVGVGMTRAALAEIHERGMPLSVLYPATNPVYRHAGFEQAGSWLTFKLNTSDIDVVQDRSMEVRRIGDGDRQAVHRAYTERARQSNGQVDRDDWMWGRVFRPRAGPGYAYMAVNGERCEGYLVFTKKTTQPPFYGLNLLDFVALTHSAARRLLTLLADHRSMSKLITWRGPLVDPILFALREQSHQVAERLDWMLRIVDLKGALESRGFAGGLTGKVELDVHDDTMPHNHGRWILDVCDGRGTARKGGNGAIRVHVRGLAPLYSGHLSPFSLRTAGLMEGADDDLITTAGLFAGPAPWMPDIF